MLHRVLLEILPYRQRHFSGFKFEYERISMKNERG